MVTTLTLAALVIRPVASIVTEATLVTPPLTPPYNPAVTDVSSKSIVTVFAPTLVVIPVSPEKINCSPPTVTESVPLSPFIARVVVIAATLS